MSQPVFVFACTILVTILTICLMFNLSFKLGLVDLPGGRKKHKNLTQLIGGIGIFIGISVTIACLFTDKIYLSYWIASLLLTVIGVTDDRYPLTFNVKFFTQFIALLIVIFFGHAVILNLGDLFGVGIIELSILSIPFTCFAMIGIINAVNMMDGVDGLTGCVSLAELLMLFFLANRIGLRQELLIITAFIGAVLSFLLFNFPSVFSLKRKIFLGDSGSMLLGLTLSWLCVRLTQGSNSYPPALMLWVMALPLMDTIYLIFNRKARGVSAFKADRRHMHHILLQLNYTARQTTLILMSASFITGAIGILLHIYGLSDWMLFYGFVFLSLIYATFSYGLKKRVVARKHKIFGDVWVRF